MYHILTISLSTNVIIDQTEWSHADWGHTSNRCHLLPVWALGESLISIPPVLTKHEMWMVQQGVVKWRFGWGPDLENKVTQVTKWSKDHS
jgi:hypothetical protein